MNERHPGPIVLDLRDVGRNRRGVARALTEIGTRLLAMAPNRYRAVCCAEGIPLLQAVDDRQLTVVSQHSQAVFEQLTLPHVATRLGAAAIYSHRECGALWGPKLLLHITEDPEVRWAREPLSFRHRRRGFGRECVRRGYSRLFMQHALNRSHVATSSHATASDLERRYGIARDRITVVPLGVDLDRFHPDRRAEPPRTPYLFHLSSDDPREHTSAIIDAFGELVGDRGHDDARLVVAGDLGSAKPRLVEQIATRGLVGKVDLLGRVTDEHLAELYAGAAATILASMDEGFGLQALEALASGSLVVSTPAPATREIAVHADVEWTSLDPGAMSGALEAAWNDRDRQQRATVTNRRAASLFTWDATAKRLDDVLTGLSLSS